MVRRPAGFIMVLLLGWTGSAAAQGAAAAAPAAAAADADHQEVTEVLVALDEAGAPATTAEITEFLTESSAGAMQGVLLGRTGWTVAGGMDHSVRLRVKQRWLTVRGRWRRYRDGSVQLAGAMIAGPEHWQFAVGQLGLAHGFGLLVGAPGRGPSLTADGRLGSGGGRLVPWSGAAVAQTVLGAGLNGSWHRIGFRALVGRRGPSGNAGPMTAAGQGTAGGEHWQASVLFVSDPLEKGASLTARFDDGVLAGSCEGAWRRPTGARTLLTSFLVQGGWRPHRKSRLEIMAGWADLGPRPVMGQKQPVFGDWAGQGVAVRGTWRPAAGLGVKLLVQRGRGRQEVSAGQRRVRTLSDALLTRSWPGGWRAAARWREGAENVATWSERFPWQPPAPAWRDNRRVLSLKAGWRGERGRGQVLWRRLTLARIRQEVGWESGGSRNLVTLTGGKALGKGANLRAGWSLSWGDPVDLVSAVVPYRGYVLPRHWGHWRAEHLVGLELRRGPWQGRAAVSWRQADRQTGRQAAPVADALAAWLEGVWSW